MPDQDKTQPIDEAGSTGVAPRPSETRQIDAAALPSDSDPIPAGASSAGASSEARPQTPAPGQSGRPRGFMSRLVPKSPSAAIQPVPAPPPPPAASRTERPWVNFMSGLFSFLLVIGLAAATAVFLVRRQIEAPGPLAGDKVVIVRGGAADVTEQLHHEGVIDRPVLFMMGLYATGAAGKIKAGEYLFRREASLGEVMDTLVEGKSVLHSLLVPEGLTSEQIVERIRENDVLSGEIRDVPREGTLLPETYKFTRGMSRSQLLDRMAQDQARVVREIWSRRAPDLPLRSPQELVILASIVEKETGRADERTRVAGVFVNRLTRNMRLQSDPTIIYGLVGGKGSLGRPITRSDIESQTPFNTYVIPGLPPGPIGNPGRASLEAVANPSRTRDLFFVADGTGGHVFAETLEQHNRNVARWRQIEAERRETAAPPASVSPSVPVAVPVQAQNVGAVGNDPLAGDPVPNADLPKNPPLPPVPPSDIRGGDTAAPSGARAERP
jgi:UPF0755 protein